MQSLDIVKECPVVQSSRVKQIEGIFQLESKEITKHEWHLSEDFLDAIKKEDWNIGVIVGPSGTGKTTIAKELFKEHYVEKFFWPKEKAIVDGFSKKKGIKDITQVLSSVGFSSPPSWLKPFHVLSTGEKFRVTIARALIEQESLIVFDEFTSVVDRTVAKIGSAAVSKAIKKRKQKFIAVSCHYDILEWLEPDWIYQPHLNLFENVRGRLRRPKIELSISKVKREAWKLFKEYHYMNTKLNPVAQIYCAFYEGFPVAMLAFVHFPMKGNRKVKRFHRLVCHPDFQGVGIGIALHDYVAKLLSKQGFRVIGRTSHPVTIRHVAKSPRWKIKGKPSLKSGKWGYFAKWNSKTKKTERYKVSHEYVP